MSIISWSGTQVNTLLIWKECIKFSSDLKGQFCIQLANVNKSLIKYFEYIFNTGFIYSANHFANLWWTDLIINKIEQTGTLFIWVLGNQYSQDCNKLTSLTTWQISTGRFSFTNLSRCFSKLSSECLVLSKESTGSNLINFSSLNIWHHLIDIKKIGLKLPPLILCQVKQSQYIYCKKFFSTHKLCRTAQLLEKRINQHDDLHRYTKISGFNTKKLSLCIILLYG